MAIYITKLLQAITYKKGVKFWQHFLFLTKERSLKKVKGNGNVAVDKVAVKRCYYKRSILLKELT